MPVVELRVGHGPAVVFGGGFDAAAYAGGALQHRALPRPAGFRQVRGPGLLANPVSGGGDGLQHAVGQVIDQRHQKVTAAHRRVANFEFKHLAGRVERVERIPIAGVERAPFCELVQVRVKCLDALGCQQADRLAQDEAYQVVMRVVTARHLAGKAGGHGDDAVDLKPVFVAVCGLHFMHQAVLKQALVNAAQVRDGQVAVVDPGGLEGARACRRAAARQGVDDGCHDCIGHVGAH